jgi:hypothetical protein
VHIMFIMMTFIILVMSSYGGNKVVGWGLPEGPQVPTLRPILNVSDNLHISGDVPTMYLRSMMSMNVLNLLVQVRLIECCWCRINIPIMVRVLNK